LVFFVFLCFCLVVWFFLFWGFFFFWGAGVGFFSLWVCWLLVLWGVFGWCCLWGVGGFGLWVSLWVFCVSSVFSCGEVCGGWWSSFCGWVGFGWFCPFLLVVVCWALFLCFGCLGFCVVGCFWWGLCCAVGVGGGFPELCGCWCVYLGCVVFFVMFCLGDLVGWWVWGGLVS